MKLNTRELFANRHLAPSPQDVTEMLAKVGADSIATLIQETIPPKIQNTNPLNQLSPALSEDEYLAHIEGLLNKNKVFRSYIGQGYFGTIIPPVIQRNILENPGWYTAYTPYQAEISQGRMEMLINYQTMVTELTGMDLSNASLLDEATAAAEAMTMLYGARKGPKKKSRLLFD
jgi:glycine dehydrogenase